MTYTAAGSFQLWNYCVWWDHVPWVCGGPQRLAGLASLGLPGLSGFVSEVLVFLGAFSVWSGVTAIAVFGIVLTAGYILWMLQRVFYTEAQDKYDGVGDADKAAREARRLLGEWGMEWGMEWWMEWNHV